MSKDIVGNYAIPRSIPLDSSMKRYYIKWFSRMRCSNGHKYAVDHVKNLRVLLMQYISDPNRSKDLKRYVAKAPIRKNRRLYQLFSYADTNPHAVLAFLKFYLDQDEPSVTVEESEAEMHQLLESIDWPVEIPRELKSWLEILVTYDTTKVCYLYWDARENTNHPFHYVCMHHSLEDWASYWRQWKHRLITRGKWAYRRNRGLEAAANKVPTPSVYKDFQANESEQFCDDVREFLSFFPDMRGGVESIPLECLDWILDQMEPDMVFGSFELDDLIGDLDPDSVTVGQIHHIPKKGTDVRRPIAVPNRFLQLGMAPYGAYLYELLRGLPRDHTFDQTKSTSYIQHRLNRGYYTCSVDLSHATDYLPKDLGDYIVCYLLGFTRANEHIEHSRALFDYVCRCQWRNGDNLSRWKVGQPLGTLPSFGLLGLTHNVLLEALALASGYLHSPYTVLGDDVLLFSKRMRRLYITTMNQLGVPLSLHKSYEHNLVEFAGQILIKNQEPRYTPDPSKVYWSNLFDYSRSSGFLLSWRSLPSSIRNRLTRVARSVSLSGDKFYRLAAELYFASVGSPYSSYMEKSMRLLPEYVANLESEQAEPDPDYSSGWAVVTIDGTDRLLFTGRARVNRDAKGNICKDPSKPDWFKQKYRPTTTDNIVRTTVKALEASTPTDE